MYQTHIHTHVSTYTDTHTHFTFSSAAKSIEIKRWFGWDLLCWFLQQRHPPVTVLLKTKIVLGGKGETDAIMAGIIIIRGRFEPVFSPKLNSRHDRLAYFGWSLWPQQSLWNIPLPTSKETLYWRLVGPTCLTYARDNTGFTSDNVWL